MNNNYCYEELTIKLSADNPLLTEYKSLPCGHIEVPGNLYDSKNTFKQCTVPMHYFKNEPIGEIINKYNLTPKLFLIEAGYAYNWHRDAFRFMTINMSLEESPDYLVVFSHEYPHDTDGHIKLNKFTYKPVTKIKYEPRSFYVFNTQIPHLSINHSNVDRYVLTIAKFQSTPVPSFFNEQADQSHYFKFINDLKNQNLIK